LLPEIAMKLLPGFALPLLLASGSVGPVFVFREVPHSESGITWLHENARSANRYLPETAGPGVAIFDYNNDGKMDILFVNSGQSSFYTPQKKLHHALYRNNGDGTFTDVTQQAGITADLFGMGIAIGDYDGDGWPDIFLTGYGRAVLYHNNGNGTFSDVTAKSGIAQPQWGTSAVWFDYDNDGKLDLFIGQFANYSEKRICQIADSYGGGGADVPAAQAYYCNPQYFAPLPSRLYRNLGNGRFEDVSARTGILSKPGKAWGVVAADIDGDGYMDLFVSNDTMPNFLWMNRHGEKFEEIGLESGVGYSADGTPRSGMGVDAGDFDNDGRIDLIVDNMDQQTTSLYRNTGDESFEDLNAKSGLAAVTRMFSGWGLAFLDYDNDGWQDLILSHGYPDDMVDERHRGVTYREPLLLMRNLEGRTLQSVGEGAGPAFGSMYAARGLAVGDLNNDGYPDIVFTENGGPPHLLMNNAAARNHWLGLNLRPKTANPAAAGAVIRWSIDGKVYSRVKIAGGSFLSSRDPRELIGSGKQQIEWVEVKWPAPSTCVDRMSAPPMDRYIAVAEGQSPASK
jgi:enediyne biosynthesis protein E4